MAVPYIFATAVSPIPLSQLDTNFATAITLGNTAMYLGNTVTTVNALTLTNVTISSGSVNLTSANIVGNLSITGNLSVSATSTLNVASINTVSTNVIFSSTGAITVPVGTTGQEPGTPSTGMFRFNTTIGQFEGYNGSAWGAVGSGATGGGPDQIFIENGQTVTTSYSIPSGKNALTTGPISINGGVTVTVPSGSRWLVL